jgi:hypothetical protein
MCDLLLQDLRNTASDKTGSFNGGSIDTARRCITRGFLET